MSTGTLISGFENPVLDSLRNFRQLSDVLARPGKVAELPKLIGPQGIYKTSFSILLTLLDTKSSVYLSEEYRVDSVMKNLAFHCNCSYDVSANKADFALVNGANPIDVNQFNAGCARDPHQSTSLVIEIDAIAVSEEEVFDTKFVLSGPGIQSQQTVSLKGLHASFVDYLTHRTHAFPTGLDMFFMTGDKVMAIPRTTHVKVVEA